MSARGTKSDLFLRSHYMQSYTICILVASDRLSYVYRCPSTDINMKQLGPRLKSESNSRNTGTPSNNVLQRLEPQLSPCHIYVQFVQCLRGRRSADSEIAKPVGPAFPDQGCSVL